MEFRGLSWGERRPHGQICTPYSWATQVFIDDINCKYWMYCMCCMYCMYCLYCTYCMLVRIVCNTWLCSMYPVYPPGKDINVDMTQYNALDITTDLDVLVLPSLLGPFAKVCRMQNDLYTMIWTLRLNRVYRGILCVVLVAWIASTRCILFNSLYFSHVFYALYVFYALQAVEGCLVVNPSRLVKSESGLYVLYALHVLHFP